MIPRMRITASPQNLATIRPAARRSARYGVELACEVIGQQHDTPQLMWATDLSADGLWLESSQSLRLGETLVVSFQPAVAWRGREFTLFGQVARASAGRRYGDIAAGLGIRFVDLDAMQRHTLVDWLRPRSLRAGGRNSRRVRRARQTPFHPTSHPFATRLC